MAQPVWVLSVDLQTKTATFTSGLADAAKGARGSFNDIKESAREMGGSVRGSMMEARHGVMLLGEEFGVHLPRALTSFIASIGPVGAAMEAAFPFLAIIVGATLLLEHLSKLKEKGEQLTESQVKFGTTVTDVLNGLDNKLLEAGIKTDELNHNHLAALNKQLELIDRQSMNELVQAFGAISKEADATFAQLKTSWYQWGVGSDGAKASLERFKVEYDSLLAHKDEKGAQELLDKTIEREEKILALKKQASASQTHSERGGQKGDYNKFEEAKLALQKMGLDLTKVDLTSQQRLVDTLHAQLDAVSKINAIKDADKNHANQATDDKIGGEADKVARERAAAERHEVEESQKLWEQNYREAVSRLQESEREKITATDKGSQERLAAIDAAIHEENAKGLQETGFYKSLLTSRIETTKQMTDEENRLRAEAGKQEAEHTLKMGELDVAAERTISSLKLSAMRNARQARLADALQFADEDYKLKAQALAGEVSALDKGGKDYENKLKALQNKELELTREHENQMMQIRAKAEEEQNTRVLSSMKHFDESVANSAAQTLMRKQSAAKMMIGLGDQIAEGMMKNAIMAILTNDMTKPSDAAYAARQGFKDGQKFPFPTNLVMAPLLAASAFASVMAFAEGGIVPGVGKGDIVPARLEPGEAVLPKRLTENLQHEARFGKQDGGNTHVHHTAHYTIHAVDGASVKNMLDNHAETFTRHFHSELRKMNK